MIQEIEPQYVRQIKRKHNLRKQPSNPPDLANKINWKPNQNIYCISARKTPMRFGQGRRGAEGKGRRSGDTWTSSKDQRPKSLTSWVGASTSAISSAGEIEGVQEEAERKEEAQVTAAGRSKP